MNIGFVLYESRSGLTFLSRQLHEFDAMYVTTETAFISRIIDGKISFKKTNVGCAKNLINYSGNYV